jgi:ribosomal protein S18 acetylase RimI-like enzyme
MRACCGTTRRSRCDSGVSQPRVVFARAVLADAGEILTVQRAAFVQEAQRYGDPNVPPLTETLDQVRSAIVTTRVVVGRIGPRLVAAGRLDVRDRVGHVGRLAVAPDVQGQGVGRALLAAVEAAGLDDVDDYVLFTGHETLGNLHLYHSAGYRDTHTEHVVGDLSFIHMRKSTRGTV